MGGTEAQKECHLPIDESLAIDSRIVRRYHRGVVITGGGVAHGRMPVYLAGACSRRRLLRPASHCP